MDDKKLVMTLLGSLSEEYKLLVTSLDAVSEDSLTFKKIKRMLLNNANCNMDTLYTARHNLRQVCYED